MIKDRLKEMLELRGISPAELSRKAKLSPGLISEIINGRNKKPSLTSLEKISEALGIGINFFLEEDVIGPTQILSHLTKDEIKFVMNENHTPFIELTKKAVENGVTEEQFKYLLKALVINSK